jgi:hypothetical protein
VVTDAARSRWRSSNSLGRFLDRDEALASSDSSASYFQVADRVIQGSSKDDCRMSAPRAHRHDDLEVTGFEFADGPQHTRPLVSRELEVYLRTSDDLKGIS